MIKPVSDMTPLTGDHLHVVIWQEVVDGVPEPAIVVRTYSDKLVGVRQGDSEILINASSADEVCKFIKRFAAHDPRPDKK